GQVIGADGLLDQVPNALVPLDLAVLGGRVGAHLPAIDLQGHLAVAQRLDGDGEIHLPRDTTDRDLDVPARVVIVNVQSHVDLLLLACRPSATGEYASAR